MVDLNVVIKSNWFYEDKPFKIILKPCENGKLPDIYDMVNAISSNHFTMSTMNKDVVIDFEKGHKFKHLLDIGGSSVLDHLKQDYEYFYNSENILALKRLPD